MSERKKVTIKRLPTGVLGLDKVLGGGVPEYSFNLIAGPPGAGKTTLAHQIMFTNALPERPALYFTVLGESPLKMLRYQQQMQFFNSDKVDTAVRFVNLSQQLLENGLTTVLQAIQREVETTNPGLVIVDSFRTLSVTQGTLEEGKKENQLFTEKLALYLASWQTTSFLVGEYSEAQLHYNPVFTVSDGILWLFQSIERNSVIRKLQVIKMRGQAPMPGLHIFRITDQGLHVFPRLLSRPEQENKQPNQTPPPQRVSLGIAGLDEMLDGGIPAGNAVLLAGPSGSGKTTLCSQFIAQGLSEGEPGVIITFEEHPQEYQSRARALDLDLIQAHHQGKLQAIYLRPVDLSMDETLQEILQGVKQLGAKRVVVDSLSGFELALAPTYREDFRDSLYRMVSALTGTGVTLLMSVEVTQSYANLSFTPYLLSFLSDVLILQRYIELQGQLRRAMTIVKMRGSAHSKDFREYEITQHGIKMGGSLKEYCGILTGVPHQREVREAFPGLTARETQLLQALIKLGEASMTTLGQCTGLDPAALTAALQRLQDLNYVFSRGDAEQAIYRPTPSLGKESNEQGADSE